MTQTTERSTAHPSTRRTLHFDTIDQAIAEVDQLAAAQQQGKLRTVGNWSPGQNLGHLAAWVDYSYDGVPFKIPFINKLFMRPMKNRILCKPMKAGSRIPKVPGGTAGIDPLPFDEGLARFRQRFTRIKTECPQKPNALFGPLTHAEWIALHLRHAELHLSYLRTD